MQALLAALFLSLSAVSAQESQPAQSATNGDALVVWSAGLERLAPDARDAGVVRAVQGLEAWMDQLQATLGTPVPAGPRIAARWIQRPLDLRLGLTDAGSPRVHLTLSFDDLESAQAEISALREALHEQGVEISGSGDEPASFWTPTPEGPFAVRAIEIDGGAVLALALGRPPRADLARPTTPGLGEREPAFVVQFDGSTLSSGLKALVEKENAGDPKGKRVADGILSVLEGLDLVGPKAPRRTCTVSHGEVDSITLGVVENWAGSHAGERGAARITRADLQLVPADTIWVWLGNIHPAALIGLAEAVDAEATGKALSTATAMTGVDLERDLLAKIGPLAGAYTAQSSGGSSLMGLVLFARSEDAGAVVATLQKLLASVPGPAEQRPFHMETWSHEGSSCTSLSFPGLPVPVEPSLTAKDGVIFLAMGRNALRQALDQMASERSLSDHPRLSNLTEAAFQDLVGLGFLDSPACVQRGYATLSMALAGLNNMARGKGGPDLSKLLPTGSKLAEGLRPTLSVTNVRGKDLITVTAHDRSWVARGTAAMGSPVGETNPLAASMVAAIAIPKLLTARLAANESAAIATLRSLSSAQAQVQASSLIDADGDGVGEYGFLGELAGAQPVRGTGARIDPPLLSASFGVLEPGARGGAVVKRSGYVYQVWLPGARGGPVCESIEGQAKAVSANDAEILWSAYAWPIDAGSTGNRCFYIDQEGDLLFFPNNGGIHGGADNGPDADAVRARAGKGGAWQVLE